MAISSTAELMLRYIDDPMAREDLHNLHSDTERAISIVRNLLSFARKQEPQRKLISINEVINSVISLRAYELRLDNIEVITNLDPEILPTMADFQQMQQVFLNLLINAEQAMKEMDGEGRLEIETSTVGDKIRITFTDNGPGIPSDTIGRIFEPFFTTKEVGEGTGLGLSICYGIVQEHGGTICAESTEGKGAKFVVELPIITEPLTESAENHALYSI